MHNYFENDAAEFVYVRSYSRWIPEENRRETWPETVKRYVDFLRKHRGDVVPNYMFRDIENAILNFEVMPSMRALWAAGEAAEADNLTMYNCSYSAIDSIESFAECLYVLMCGAGFGFDVTKESVSKLPVVPELISTSNDVHIVADNREGWADSVKALMRNLYDGKDITFNYSRVRPKGARLKTMGGRASGPEPLMSLHDFIREMFRNAPGRRLKPIECHDICNKIAEIVIVGGVRRSSEISLSDIDDEEMRNAKNWPFPEYRSMANNSVVYNAKPSLEDFQKEWKALEESGTGERGFFNLEAARRHAPKRRKAQFIQGINPCAEILLRNRELCNLSEVVIRENDTFISLSRKVRLATIIGTIQSTFTYFPYLRSEWADNCREERLLGVSLTGIMDAVNLTTDENLTKMKRVAYDTAVDMAALLNINVPAAITCGKPSGTVSQLTNSASGMHPRFAKHYIRRYRISSMDPLFKMMCYQGFTFVPEVGQGPDAKTWVVEFPVAAASNAITREAVSAIDQLKLYKLMQQKWSEHNCSLTVYCRTHEWEAVGQWLYNNWGIVKGVSFLNYSDHKYELAPYEEISEQTYKIIEEKMPKIDYTQLSKYEMEDNTEGAKSYACVGDRCELV